MPGPAHQNVRPHGPPAPNAGAASHSNVPQPDHSILSKNAPSKIAKKGVEFDPTMKPHDLEDTDKKGHSVVMESHHKEEDAIDLSGDHGKHIFCKNLFSSLYPLAFLLKCVGRFPLSRKRSSDHKTYEYTASHMSMAMLHFNVTTIVLFYSFFVGLFSIAKVMLDLSTIDPRFKRQKHGPIYEKQAAFDTALIQRNAVPLVIIFMTLVQACITSVLFTKKREYLAHIFSFLNKAAFNLHMDLAENAKNFSVQSTVLFTVFTCMLIMFSSLKVGPVSSGTPAIFGSLMLRAFLGLGKDRFWLDPDNKGSILLVKVLGGVFLVTIYTASLAPILLFIYKCKIVRNAFAIWNGRAYCALLRGREFAQTEEGRTTYNLLFKDHCILLDLLDSVDQMYSFTLESFFGLQVISLFFQMYFFFRAGSQTKLSDVPYRVKYDSVRFMRPYDWLPALVILVATSITLFCAGRAAINVAVEAEAGAEVIRRKGVIGRRTDQELEFLYSMNFSFQAYKRMEVSGAGYLYYNKLFLIQLLAVSVFCFLLLYQFRPLLDYKPGSDVRVSRFLRKIEGTSDFHDEWVNSSDDREWALGT